jgi:hypothetical protein
MTRSRRTHRTPLRVFLALLACAAPAAPLIVQAQSRAAQSAPQTGIDSIHAQARVGSRICMTEHEHYGESAPWVSRKGAEAAAIRHWATFTAWEYGRVWGAYASAVGKTMTCEQMGGMWVCKTTARPCRSER